MNQGRLIRVLLSLVIAMTVGSVVLLTLEGKPIKPMAYSLSSQIGNTSFNKILGTEVAIVFGRWQHIEICYQANNGQLSEPYGLSGAFSSEYHFVISNGSVGYDGQIFASPRWTRQLPCLASNSIDDLQNSIRICLITPDASTSGTPTQQQELEALVASLGRHCKL